MKSDQKQTLLRFWTTRYLVTLFIGLLLIGFLSVVWLKHMTVQNRLDINKYIAQELAERIVEHNGLMKHYSAFIPKLLKERQQLLDVKTMPHINIVDVRGNSLFKSSRYDRTRLVPNEILESSRSVLRISFNQNDIYIVKAPIIYNEEQVGWVLVSQSKRELAELNEEYRLLFIMLISLGLLGWMVIYFFTKKLSTPLQNVVSAAKEIQNGNYQVTLEENVKEKELHELIHSFKEMSARLQQLEKLRAELLASVTHELKTPVTSISSLNQALKDQVVTGDEAKEFLDISIKETKRLQKMIGDLLDFNVFATGSIQIQVRKYCMNDLIKEIVHQWEVLQDQKLVEVNVELPGEPIDLYTDAARVEQIIVNLLNNAYQAIEGKGKIDVSLMKRADGMIEVVVKDNGPGIPEEERNLIFERFYRGKNKKYKVRGLGIGLPFSKMMAEALGGTLRLKESHSQGTTFSLLLRDLKEKEKQMDTEQA